MIICHVDSIIFVCTGRTMFAKLLVYAAGGVVLVVAAAFAAFTAYLTYIYWKYSHLPSPKRSSFFFGHALDFVKYRKEVGYQETPITEIIMRWSMDVQKPVFVIFLVGMPWVIPISPEFVKEISMKPLNDKPKHFWKDFQALFGERFAGKSVLTTLDYETWQPKRKLYDPCFKKTYLEGLIPAFNESVDKFLQKLKPLADGKTGVPINKHFHEVALDVISKVAFGSDSTAMLTGKASGLKKSEKTSKLLELVDSSMKGLALCMEIPFTSLYQLQHPLEVRGYRESVRELRKIGRDCIEKRIAAIQSGEKVPNDILSQILQTAATKLTDDLEELVDDFVAFYIAGQETSASLLSFATAQIHLNPHILEMLVAEVDEVLGDKDTVSAEDLNKLEYTEQVLMETLRTHQPVGGFLKCPREDIYLGEFCIPAKTVIILPTSAMCRMPEFFDKPEVFDPSRFDPQNERPNPFVYFPFGLGHRSCIGKPFALTETKITLARLLQQFRLTIPPDYKILEVQRTMTRLKHDLTCTLTQRKK